MQTIREPVLNLTRTILPLGGAVCPVRTVRDVSPCSDIGKAGHQCIKVAIQPVELAHRFCHHIRTKNPLCRQRSVDASQHVIVIFIQALSKIGNTGDIPEQTHGMAVGGSCQNFRAAGQRRQCLMIQRIALSKQERQRRWHLKRGQQRVHRGKIQITAAPVESTQRLESMLFNGLDHFRVKRAAAISDTKGTIIDMSASPAGNLRHLRRRQSAHPPSIIFDIGR